MLWEDMTDRVISILLKGNQSYNISVSSVLLLLMKNWILFGIENMGNYNKCS